jgi:hypothetical protein
LQEQCLSVSVTNNDEMIIYCGVAAHRKAGMVGIFKPTSPAILDTYAQAAKAVKISVAPPMMAGGVYTKDTTG